jgi:hypothetical protein
MLKALEYVPEVRMFIDSGSLDMSKYDEDLMAETIAHASIKEEMKALNASRSQMLREVSSEMEKEIKRRDPVKIRKLRILIEQIRMKLGWADKPVFDYAQTIQKRCLIRPDERESP